MRRTFVALLLAVTHFACDAAITPLDAGLADSGASDAPVLSGDAGPPPVDFDGFVEWQMAAGGIPGAALAIVTPDETIRLGGYGMADIESGRAVDADTLFIMASISKTFAAVRAMQLVEAGTLDLDAPIEDYLGYPVLHPEHPAELVSTRRLLTHTSGLEDNFASLLAVTTNADPSLSLDEFTRAYALEGGSLYRTDHWGAAPGTRRSYANAGFGVVGAVLEGAGGAPFDAQTQAGIFEPLALGGAAWFIRNIDLTRVATPYGWNGRRFNALPQSGFAYYPASSLRISATGLARFATMILRRGELEGTRVLSPESVDEMLRVQFPDISRRQALAFSESVFGELTYIGHSGSTFGSSTQLLIARDGSHALLLITNSDAYVRSRVLMDRSGSGALTAIIERMVEEASAL